MKRVHIYLISMRHSKSQINLGVYMNYKCYVINLDKDKDRLDKVKENINLDLERFPAISDTKSDKNTFPMTMMSRNEICCALSHIKLWEKLVRDEMFNYYVIFEDDARSYGDVRRELETFVNNYDNDEMFDILYLGKCYDKCSKLEPTRYPNIYRAYRPLCTHAYMISREYAEKLLSTWVTSPIDFHINSGKGRFLTYHPSLVYQETISLNSTLTNSSVAARGHVNDCSGMDPEIVSTKIKSNNFYILIITTVVLILVVGIVYVWIKGRYQPE